MRTLALGRCEHRGCCLTRVGFGDAGAAACLAIQRGNNVSSSETSSCSYFKELLCNITDVGEEGLIDHIKKSISVH